MGRVNNCIGYTESSFAWIRPSTTTTTLLVASSIAQGARGLGTGVAAGLTLLGT